MKKKYNLFLKSTPVLPHNVQTKILTSSQTLLHIQGKGCFASFGSFGVFVRSSWLRKGGGVVGEVAFCCFFVAFFGDFCLVLNCFCLLFEFFLLDAGCRKVMMNEGNVG